MKKLSDLVVVITGASSGIGRGTALEIARQQGNLVLASRNTKALREVARECQKLGGRVLHEAIDVTDLRAVKNLARRAIGEFGKIDVWVNNAAVTLFARFEEAPEEAYRKVIETNLFGYMNGARAALPYFREQGRGILINVSSMIGKIGSPYVSAYATSKFAINGWAESLRMELQDAPGIHVCTLLPASIDTPIFEHAANYTGRAIKPMSPVYSPKIVVDAILGCIQKPRREIYVGKAGTALSGVRSIAPGAAEKMMARQVDKDHFKDERDDEDVGNLFEARPDLRHSIDGGWNGKEPVGAAGVLAAAAVLAGIGLGVYLAKTGIPMERARHRIPPRKSLRRRVGRKLGELREKLPIG